MKLFEKAIYAGASIAIGCILYILVPNKILGALLFSIGLLNVRTLSLPLYTGKIQEVYKSKISYTDLSTVLLGNVIGCFFIAALSLNVPEILSGAAAIVNTRLSTSVITLFCMSFFCGMLMTIATQPTTPLLLSSACVIGFITIGGVHSIADAFYYIVGASAASFKLPIFWLISVVGNFCGGYLIAYEEKPY